MNEWSNWSGRVKCHPERILDPVRKDEIKDIVREASEHNERIRVAGSGHSFTDLVNTDETLVSLKNYTGLTGVNREENRASARAGTPLSQLGPRLYENGLAMENLGDIDEQSLAGAISTGTHGTGIQFGVLATQLSKIELMTPAEGLIECSESENRDLFKAAQVSLGSLGILTELTLELEPAYNLHEVVRKESLDNCLNNLETLRKNNRHFEFFWFPQTETVWLKTLNKTDEPGDVPEWTFSELLDNTLFELMCRTGNRLPFLTPFLNRVSASGASTADNVGPAHKVFSTMRTVRFNEMEYGVPASSAAEAFRHLRDFMETQHPEVQFPVEFRYVQGDDIHLSPAHGEDRAFMAIHKYHKKPYEDFFRGAESIFEEYDGRPHWGKMHYRSTDELKSLYPEWERFQSIRKSLDPQGVFLNDYLQQLFET